MFTQWIKWTGPGTSSLQTERKVAGVCGTQDIHSLENYSRDLNECFDRENGGGGGAIYIYDAGILIK